MTLCVTLRYYIEKVRHFTKGRQFALRFYRRNFNRISKLDEGGGYFYI